MDSLGPAAESLRLSEHYRQMSDEELIELARDKSALTDLAQQTLETEIRQRRLQLEEPENRTNKLVWHTRTELQPDASTDEDSESDQYAEGRQLVQIADVWSLNDAMQLQYLLDRAGIPFVMGKEQATRAESVTSNFAAGVPVEVMRIGVPWTWRVLENYQPRDVPPNERDMKWEDLPKVSIHCPKCHSADVTFDRLVSARPAESGGRPSDFHWTCGSCGHEWEDSGIQTER